MARPRKDPETPDPEELQDRIADLEDGAVDALEHLRSGRIEKAVRALERVAPEEEEAADPEGRG